MPNIYISIFFSGLLQELLEYFYIPSEIFWHFILFSVYTYYFIF